MKRLLIAIFLLCASTAWAGGITATGVSMTGATTGVAAAVPSITYVASSGAAGTAADSHIHLAFGASTTTGDLLVVMLSLGTSDPPVVGVGTFIDDRGNTWTRNLTQGGPNLGSAIYSAIAKDAGTVTITATPPAPAYIAAYVMAFRGVVNNTPDTSSTAFASSTDAHHGNLVTSAITVNIGFSREIASTASTVTPDANWTACLESEVTNYVSSACYRITTAAGTYNDGWTYGTNNFWKAMGVAYK
jgi:hypothetical protein